MQSKTGLTAAFIGLALLTINADGANQPVTMRVSPAVSFAPANLVIRARLEPYVNNRAMEVIAESADFYRSSVVPLEGKDAARTTRIEFRGLPGGQYVVRTTLLGSDGRPRASTAQELNIIGIR